MTTDSKELPVTTTLASDLARTILRVALGVVFLAHGWQKFFQFTIPGAQAAFGTMGIPAAEIAAPVAASLELVGGAALILGLVTRIAAAALAVQMLVALVLVHLPAGLFSDKGGVEFVLVLAAGAAALALVGPGRLSVDGKLFGRREDRWSPLAA
ncbi:DoxX family protein [Sinomonas mesophila]|uniref:DoxX family protein n=1 Tax=Sinomonas mesophila TaxID=1531955 RepID=UPI0009870BD6|nr:DoxX family protein [Sinomonas mesophila]